MTQFKKNEADILWLPFDIPIEELGKGLIRARGIRRKSLQSYKHLGRKRGSSAESVGLWGLWQVAKLVI